jgi:hypothetical protein
MLSKYDLLFVENLNTLKVHFPLIQLADVFELKLPGQEDHLLLSKHIIWFQCNFRLD